MLEKPNRMNLSLFNAQINLKTIKQSYIPREYKVSLNYRWRKNLGRSREHLRRNVKHDGAQAHSQGQPLLLQVQGGRGQVEGVRDFQVSSEMILISNLSNT